MAVRAIVFQAPNEVIVRDDLRPPPLRAADVEVETSFSGISVGTERNFLTAGSYQLGFPQLAGYQLAGTIRRAGPAVVGMAEGDRIFAHLFWSRPFPDEMFTWVGSHASLLVGPSTGPIHRLPDDFPDDEAALLSIASIGFHGAQRGRVTQGLRVLVFGLGMIGQFAAQAARILGGAVVGVDPNPSRRAAAEGQGTPDVVDSTDREWLWERLAELGPFDVVLETSSGPGIIGECVIRKVLRAGARVVMLGGRERLDYPFNRAQEMELELVHSMHHSEEDVQRVMELRQAGTFGIGPLITHRLAPHDVPGFWQRVLAGERDFLGVVIDWSR